MSLQTIAPIHHRTVPLESTTAGVRKLVPTSAPPEVAICPPATGPPSLCRQDESKSTRTHHAPPTLRRSSRCRPTPPTTATPRYPFLPLYRPPSRALPRYLVWVCPRPKSLPTSHRPSAAVTVTAITPTRHPLCPCRRRRFPPAPLSPSPTFRTPRCSLVVKVLFVARAAIRTTMDPPRHADLVLT